MYFTTYFNYNNGSSSKEYIYQRNIQGDIIGIYDDKGNQVGGYIYDGYGNHTITSDVDNILSGVEDRTHSESEIATALLYAISILSFPSAAIFCINATEKL